MEVQVKFVEKIFNDILKNWGCSEENSALVTESLLINELNSYHSHGLMRINHYYNSFKKGHLNTGSKPVVTKVNDHISHVDAQKSFGVLAKKAIVDELISLSENSPISGVSVSNSHHVGRLSDIGHELSGDKNLFVIGFCNYMGEAKIVAPPGNNIPRVSTNPMLFSFPSDDKNPPFVLDISTSTVAGGKVSNAYLNNEKAPEGSLIRKDTLEDTDNATDWMDRNALLSPLGHPFVPHKGFGLAVFVEAIVALLGGKYSINNPSGDGNSLFIIAINPYLVNNEFSLEESRKIIQACYENEYGCNYPGKNSLHIKSLEEYWDKSINIPDSLYETLIKLQGSADLKVETL